MDVLVDSDWDGFNRFGWLIHGGFLFLQKNCGFFVFDLTCIMYLTHEKSRFIDGYHGLMKEYGFNLQAR